MFLACADHEAAQRFFARLVHPVDGAWLTLCRDIAAGDGEQPERDEVAAFVAEVAAHHEDLGCDAGWRAAAPMRRSCRHCTMSGRRADSNAAALSRQLAGWAATGAAVGVG